MRANDKNIPYDERLAIDFAMRGFGPFNMRGFGHCWCAGCEARRLVNLMIKAEEEYAAARTTTKAR